MMSAGYSVSVTKINKSSLALVPLPVDMDDQTKIQQLAERVFELFDEQINLDMWQQDTLNNDQHVIEPMVALYTGPKRTLVLTDGKHTRRVYIKHNVLFGWFQSSPGDECTMKQFKLQNPFGSPSTLTVIGKR